MKFRCDTREKIEAQLKEWSIKSYTINSDLTVDVNGDINISKRKLKELPFQFGKIGGGFYCSYNQLTSLEGAPRKVGGGFDCSDNQLSSLEGAPREVSGGFYCSDNPVSEKTLKSAFERMKRGSFWEEAIRSIIDEIPTSDLEKLDLPPDLKHKYRGIITGSKLGILEHLQTFNEFKNIK